MSNIATENEGTRKEKKRREPPSAEAKLEGNSSKQNKKKDINGEAHHMHAHTNNKITRKFSKKKKKTKFS